MLNCRRKRFILIIAGLCLFMAPQTSIFAEWARTHIKHTQRVDLRNLGYPLINEIPANDSAITSLLTAGDGKIYGATSGRQAYLFVFDPVINKVRHLGRIKDQAGVHHALVEDKDGFIYIGTGRSILDEIEIPKWAPKPPKEDLIKWDEVDKHFRNYPDHVRYVLKQNKGVMGWHYIDILLWNEIKNCFKNYPSGHLYRYNPKESNAEVKLADMDCEVEDLGIPVANNSIYALTVSPQGDAVYGLTYPEGHFFVYDIAGKKLTDVGPIDEQVVFHGPERHWRSLPRALICDDAGRVYTTGTDGVIMYYCPSSGAIHSTGLKIPGDYYYAQLYSDYPVVEYFTKGLNGLIYGGSSDGHLFSFDPANNELINLGKPHSARRLRCMATGKDGKIYFILGERIAGRPCQLYYYDPARGGFQDLGLILVDRSPYYSWRAFQIDSMTTGTDGTIYFGESERRSHLFMYIP